MFGYFTFTDIVSDGWLVVFNILVMVCTAGVFRALVFVTKKMSEWLRGTVFFMVLSVIYVAFFKTYLADIVSGILSNVGDFIYYSRLFVSNVFLSALMGWALHIVRQTASAIIRIILKTEKALSGGVRTRCNSVRGFFKGSGLSAVFNTKPCFHYIS